MRTPGSPPKKDIMSQTQHSNIRSRRPKRNNNQNSDVITVGGQKFRLSDLPSVGYTLTCGHSARSFAIRAGDLMFCDTCCTHANIATIHD